jgi:hypothetical protein
VNERVCFHVGNLADGAFPYFGTVAPGITIGGSEAPLKGNADSCSFTDANGRAAVEVLNSDPEVINVIADFDPEGLLRSIDVAIPGPPSVVISKDPPTKTEIRTIMGPTVAGPAGPPGADRVVQQWIESARLVKRGGKVRLVVKVKSNVAGKAKLRAKVLGKRGRKLGAWTKQVRTNRVVKLKVSAKARAARVALVR